MTDLFYHIPSKIVFGLDTINWISSYLPKQKKHILLVTESILYEKKIINKIVDILSRKNIEPIIYDEIMPNATSICVDDGVNIARGAKIDTIIGLGGIKTLAIAKCIAMTTPTHNVMDDFLSGQKPEGEPLLYIEIPTTCRNPFMLTDEYFIIDPKTKTGKIGKTQENITKAVIMDPKLCESLPLKYTAATIIDALMYAIEGFISTKGNFLSDTYLTKALIIAGNLINKDPKTLNEQKSRIKASMLGFLVALGLTATSSGIGAALSYAFNARSKIPKSWTASILLPHIIEYHSNSSAEKLVTIGKLLGENLEDLSTGEAVNKSIETMRTTIGSMQLPSRLRDFDLKLEGMVEIAEIAHTFEMTNFLPRMTGIADYYEIIKSAY